MDRFSLIQQNSFLKSLLDKIPSMIGYWDASLQNRYGNQAYSTWFGISPEQMQGKHIRDVIGDERYNLNLPYIVGALRGEVQLFERAIPTPDGKSVRHAQAIYIPDIVDNVVQGFFVEVTDITSQKNAASLIASEERYRSLVEQTAEGIFLADSHGRYIDVNSSGCNMLGYSREEVLNLTFLDVLDPAEASRLSSQLVNLATGELVVSEWKFLRKDCSTFIGEVRGKQLANGNFQGILIDITERIQTANTIRASEQRLKAHIENSPLAVLSWDKDFNVTQWAGEAENMFGWSAVETLGKPLMNLNMVFEEDIPLVQMTMAKLLETSQRYVISSNRNVTKDGRVIHCTWYNSILSDKYGSMESVMSLVLDVTERTRIEQELKVSNNQLTDEVAKRTSDLSALTAHVQKVAETERANLARDLHDDMGSIMTALHLEVGRLQRKTSDPDFLSDLTVIRELISKAVQSKRNIINKLYPTTLDDYGFVHALTLMIKEYRQHSGIDVEIVMPKVDVVMAPDYALAAYRITQECLNNIAKHAGATKVQIKATAKDGFLDLTIQDNGKGMPDEISVKRHGVFGMIERARYLGGSMVIRSEYGMGTSARLHLPLYLIKPTKNKRVLVVEDHAIFRDAIRQLIDRETSDFSVEGEAADGITAIQMAIDEEWDILLLDINLPKMNGIEVLEAIKRVKPNLPIIMLSSNPKDEYSEIALSKGAACYIEKGETDKLIEEIRRVTVLR